MTTIINSPAESDNPFVIWGKRLLDDPDVAVAEILSGQGFLGAQQGAEKEDFLANLLTHRHWLEQKEHLKQTLDGAVKNWLIERIHWNSEQISNYGVRAYATQLRSVLAVVARLHLPGTASRLMDQQPEWDTRLKESYWPKDLNLSQSYDLTLIQNQQDSRFVGRWLAACEEAVATGCEPDCRSRLNIGLLGLRKLPRTVSSRPQPVVAAGLARFAVRALKRGVIAEETVKEIFRSYALALTVLYPIGDESWRMIWAEIASTTLSPYVKEKERLQNWLPEIFLDGQTNPITSQSSRHIEFRSLPGEGKSITQVHKFLRENREKSHRIICIQGEPGTGKAVVARTIHYDRKNKSDLNPTIKDNSEREEIFHNFIHFNYNYIQLKSEFLGRVDLFEQARDGTLFLYSDGSSIDQKQLLEWLHKWDKNRDKNSMNINIIASIDTDAADSNLEQNESDFEFIRMPRLSQRIKEGDLPILLNELLNNIKKPAQDLTIALDQKAYGCLRSYTWPGNISEMEKCIKECVEKKLKDLPEHIESPVHIELKVEDIKKEIHCSFSPTDDISFIDDLMDIIARAMKNVGYDPINAFKSLSIRCNEIESFVKPLEFWKEQKYEKALTTLDELEARLRDSHAAKLLRGIITKEIHLNEEELSRSSFKLIEEIKNIKNKITLGLEPSDLYHAVCKVIATLVYTCKRFPSLLGASVLDYAPI